MRTLSGPAQTALASGSAALAILVEMQFAGGTVRLATARTDIVSGGETFTAAGLAGQIDEIEDKASEVGGLRFTLSGIDTAVIAIALGEQVRGRPIKFWLAVLDSATHALLDSVLLWTGQMDTMPISQQGNTATISITAEHRGVLFGRPRPLRYTDGDQQRLHPGDRGLAYVVSQSATQDIWPAASYFRK